MREAVRMGRTSTVVRVIPGYLGMGHYRYDDRLCGYRDWGNCLREDCILKGSNFPVLGHRLSRQRGLD